jgi:hypothetical protein
MRDTLFLLAPGFFDNADGPYYCGDSAPVEGLLSFFPSLRDNIDVHYIAAQRPRQEIVELIGEDNQSAPVLVLGAGRPPKDGAIALRKYRGRGFINDEADIRKYLSSEYGVAAAR